MARASKSFFVSSAGTVMERASVLFVERIRTYTSDVGGT